MEENTTNHGLVTIRPYRMSDRRAVHTFSAADEHERPGYLQKHPRLGQYRADGLAHFIDLEPESTFIAEHCGEFIGNLLGTVSARMTEIHEETYTRRLHLRKLLRGAYGIPVWLIPIIKTERAPLLSVPPSVDAESYPAEFHIGVKREWRRQGIGTALVAAFEAYLRAKGVPGYRIYASSYHHEGVSFYRKIGLHELGEFGRRFHDGFRWLTVTEHVFVKNLRPSQ